MLEYPLPLSPPFPPSSFPSLPHPFEPSRPHYCIPPISARQPPSPWATTSPKPLNKGLFITITWLRPRLPFTLLYFTFILYYSINSFETYLIYSFNQLLVFCISFHGVEVSDDFHLPEGVTRHKHGLGKIHGSAASSDFVVLPNTEMFLKGFCLWGMIIFYWKI